MKKRRLSPPSKAGVSYMIGNEFVLMVIMGSTTALRRFAWRIKDLVSGFCLLLTKPLTQLLVYQHLAIHPSTPHLPIHLTTYPSIHHPSIHTCRHTHIHPSIRPFFLPHNVCSYCLRYILGTEESVMKPNY